MSEIVPSPAAPELQPKPLRIVELKLENLKRIEIAEMQFDAEDNYTVITGDNAAGKSSFLDGIMWILTGEGIAVPLHKGADKGTGRLVLSDGEEYTITRTITKGGSETLTVKRADKTPMPKAQTWINSILGKLAFDPLDFAKKKPKDQAADIRQLCNLDTTKEDNEHKVRFEQRAALNKQLKEAMAVIGRMTPPEEGTPDEEVSAVDLIAERDRLTNLVDVAEKATELVQPAVEAVANGQQYIATLKADYEKKLSEAEALLELRKTQAANLSVAAQAAEAARPAPDLLAAATEAVANVDTVNRKVREKRDYWKEREAASKLERQIEQYNARLKALTDAKEKKIQEAVLPVPGMAVTDEGVTIDGEYFGQLSFAEQVRCSAAVAMAMNPTLRLVLIREGANLNKANLRMIAEMAGEHDCMVFLERFCEEVSDEGIHMVDGRISHVRGELVEDEDLLEPLPAPAPAEAPKPAQGNLL